ncbi:ATP-binding protein [Massilia psychrophila]|nr:ATP-binding protein [Massilia psychrophila]GGE70583.1 histidine kinase [Massilia psychrophila]
MTNSMTTTDGKATTPTFSQQAHGTAYSTKRDGLNFNNCDSEPVQTPGCVQAHGALLVLRLADLCIVQASDNVQAVLGLSVEAMLNGPVGAVIGVDGEQQLRDLLIGQSLDRNPVYLLSLPAGRNKMGMAGMVDVTVHAIDGVAILECESTGHTGAVSADYYAMVKKTVARLQTAHSLLAFCTLAAEEIRDITGMHRVVVYKFHQDGHGEIFAESRRTDLAPWLGMHFPAEDFPKPARDMFSKIWLRPIPDISGALAEMVPLVNPDTNRPLDMTYCFLRGVSIMYTEYLQNMAVSGSATLAIRRNDQLWGLIACHHYDEPKHLPYQVRAACEFLAQVVSLQHNAAEDREHLAYRLKLESTHQQLLTVAAREGGVAVLAAGVPADGMPSLLDGIEAGGAALFHDGQWCRVGQTPDVTELTDLGEWLNDVQLAPNKEPLYATDCLVRDYPAAARFANVASGLLAVPVSRGGRDLMLWFRPETIQTVNWAGNPHDKAMVAGPNGPRLTPRVSFALFVESVRERSLPWTLVEREAAAKLRQQLVELVVDIAEQRSTLHAELANSHAELDAFNYVTSHDLKEPLRGIQQYASQLTEDAALLDNQDRNKLDRMVQLTARMDSLLESLMYFARIGKAGLTLDTVHLSEIVAEAVEMVRRPEDRHLELILPRPLPIVRCNRGWCREIFAHLISNALRYTAADPQRIEVGTIVPGELHARPGCPRASLQHTIYYVADNGIGIHAAYFSHIFKLFKRLHGRDEYGGGTGTGLTVVRKLVERHDGKIWLDSQLGCGTTFYFTLPKGDARE